MTNIPSWFDWLCICMHTHARGEEWSQKATIESTLALAASQHIEIIFDMPNLFRPVTCEQRVLERLALVPQGQEHRYRLYVGLTGEESQLIEAIRCHEVFWQVVGLKMFAGKSVGDLSVVELTAQRDVFLTLAKRKYRGVLVVHCEKESFMKATLFDWTKPISHTWARPGIAEVESVRDIAVLALETGFPGHLHIPHVSMPESVELVMRARNAGLRISCGVTPHHLTRDDSWMLRGDGLEHKVNPPLRDINSVLRLREMLVGGMIDVVETDQAPHTREEKGPPQCLSGYPSMQEYLSCVTEALPAFGLTPAQIRALTRDNVLRIFSDKF